MYENELRQAFYNDVKLLKETRLGRDSGSVSSDIIVKANFIGGVLVESPESFSGGREIWALLAVPEHAGVFAGSEYQKLATLRVPATQNMFEAYLENALAQDKGLITYFPYEVSKAKTVLRRWSYAQGSGSTFQAVDAALNVYEALSVCNELFTVLVGIYGAEGFRARMTQFTKKRTKGIGSGDRKLDYGLLMPNNLSSAVDAFKVLKVINDGLVARYYPHLRLPGSVAEFNIRAGGAEMPIGQYLIEQYRELIEMLNSRKR